MENKIIDRTIDSYISSHGIKNDQNQHNTTAEISFDKYNLKDSEVMIKELPQGMDDNAKKYYLRNELGYFTLTGYNVKGPPEILIFKVLSFEYMETPIDHYIYQSNYVNNKLFSVKTININNCQIQRCTTDINTKKYYFYEILSDTRLTDDDVRLMFYILSVVTTTLFYQVYEKNKSGMVTLQHRAFKKSTLAYIYSVDSMFPLDFKDMYESIANNNFKETFCNIAFLYYLFTTAENKINQFLNGCNLLEYLISSYITNNKKDFQKKLFCNKSDSNAKKDPRCKANYSNKLYYVAEHLFSSPEKKYFESMFVDYPTCIEDLNCNINKDSNKNAFFFFRLRNNFVHNGKSFEIGNWPDLLNSIFVINEILRILISKLDKIIPKYRKTTGIKAKDMKDIIKNRE